jgi:hypothetical protein
LSLSLGFPATMVWTTLFHKCPPPRCLTGHRHRHRAQWPGTEHCKTMGQNCFPPLIVSVRCQS